MLKCKILVGEYKGTIARVYEIINSRSLSCLIDNKKIDYGFSEVKFFESFELGKEVFIYFRNINKSINDNNLSEMTKKCNYTWHIKRKTVLKSLSLYLFN